MSMASSSAPDSEFIFYKKTLGPDRKVTVTLLKTETKIIEGDVAIVTACPDARFPGCEVRIDVETVDSPVPEDDKEDVNLHGLGDNVLFMDFRGSKSWGRKEEAFQLALEQVVQSYCGLASVRASIDVHGTIVVDTTDKTMPDTMPKEDAENAAISWATKASRSTITLKTGKKFSLESALSNCLAIISLSTMSCDSDQMDSTPVSGIILLTDTAPTSLMPEYLNKIPVRMFGMWPGLDELNYAENHDMKATDKDGIPKAAFLQKCCTWDPQTVILSPSFLGCTGLVRAGRLFGQDDNTAWVDRWGSIVLEPFDEWAILMSPNGDVNAGPPIRHDGPLKIQTMSHSQSVIIYVIPKKSFDSGADRDNTFNVFQAMLPSRLSDPQEFLKMKYREGAKEQQLIISSVMAFRPENQAPGGKKPRRKHVEVSYNSDDMELAGASSPSSSDSDDDILSKELAKSTKLSVHPKALARSQNDGKAAPVKKAPAKPKPKPKMPADKKQRLF